MLKLDKKVPHPLLYHLSFIVELTEEVFYQSEVDPRPW
jgi:hypothetical protein